MCVDRDACIPADEYLHYSRVIIHGLCLASHLKQQHTYENIQEVSSAAAAGAPGTLPLYWQRGST
jgi:hypothetical protein